MQQTEFQDNNAISPTIPGRVEPGSSSAAHSTGCISKKDLSNYLYPNLSYRSERIRKFICTADRMQRCRIKSHEELKRIRIFSPEATHIILEDLRKLGFIK